MTLFDGRARRDSDVDRVEAPGDGPACAGCSSATTAPASAASRRSPTSAPSKACSATRSTRCCATRWSSRSRAAPTRACTRGVRSCRSRRRPGSTPTGCARRSTGCSVPRSSCAPPSSSRPGSTPGARRAGARYRYTIVNRPEPDPFLARYAWWVPAAARPPRAAAGGRPVRRRARLRVVLPEADRPARTTRAAHLRVGVARPRRRRAPLRRARERVLLADGALDRRDDRRRRPRQAPPRRHAHDPAGQATARPPARWRPPHGLCLWDVGYDAVRA